MTAIESLGFQVIPHPPYRPNLAPCDFFLFPKLKEHLKGTKFNSDEKIKAEVKQWFNAQPKEFYLNGISKLVNRWQKCIALEGSYVEK
jgi:[histone H3]-lysine36 N-dimethyltransferase SETMAR